MYNFNFQCTQKLREVDFCFEKNVAITTNSSLTLSLIFSVHKTGGTTVWNMLLRRALTTAQRLAFLKNQDTFPHLDITRFLLPIDTIIKTLIQQGPDSTSLVQKIRSDSYLKDERIRSSAVLENQCDLIGSHTIYNREAIESMMGQNVLYLATVRHPTALVASMLVFFNLYQQFNISGLPDRLEVFLKDPARYDKKNTTRNSMARMFGYEIFQKFNKTEDEFLAHINATFDVIITERFDESLMLLREKYNWSFSDMLYIKIHKGNYSEKRSKSSGELIDLHRKWSSLDFKIYEMFTKRHRKLVAQKSPNVPKQLAAFRQFRQPHDSLCRNVCAILKEEAHGLTEYDLYKLMKGIEKLSVTLPAGHYNRQHTSHGTDCLLEAMTVKLLVWMVHFRQRPGLCFPAVLKKLHPMGLALNTDFHEFCSDKEKMFYNFPYTYEPYNYLGCYGDS